MEVRCNNGFLEAFDSINIPMVMESLELSLPPCIRPWATSICNHWISCNRRIVWNRHVGGRLRSDIGIPQGDPSSPLVLSLRLWAGHSRVERDHLPGKLHQIIWLDDRTLVTDNIELLQDSIHRWGEFAHQFGLQENAKKTQIVSSKHGSNMEVLGVIVGKPGRGFNQIESNKKRVEKAIWTSKRIGILPSGSHKLTDLGMFSRPVMGG